MDKSSEQHYTAAINLATEALKSLLLLNGGSATALIAISEKSLSNANYRLAVLMFGLGASFAVIAFIFGYLSQLSYANHRFGSETGQQELASSGFKSHGRWQTVALGSVIISLAFGAAGMGWALYAIGQQGDAQRPVAIAKCAPTKTVKL